MTVICDTQKDVMAQRVAFWVDQTEGAGQNLRNVAVNVVLLESRVPLLASLAFACTFEERKCRQMYGKWRM